MFILDQSGSMTGLEADTAGGFNSMLEKQRREIGDAVVSTVLFNANFNVLHDRIPITEIEDLKEEDYVPNGPTSLLDAVGRAIAHIENVHGELPEEERPAYTMVIITTDGEENSSREYGWDELRGMIERLQKRDRKEGRWFFLFLGANIDAFEAARRLGIPPECSVNCRADPTGILVNFHSISCAVSMVRSGEVFSSAWKTSIEVDFETRG